MHTTYRVQIPCDPTDATVTTWDDADDDRWRTIHVAEHAGEASAIMHAQIGRARYVAVEVAS
jgi:hypothetical protein